MQRLDLPMEVLVVEDNPAAARLTIEALKESGPLPNTHVVTDGVEALAFLRQEGQYGGLPRPDIILLDLDLPRKDGREVLAEIKACDQLRTIPVVILTTSRAEQDVLECYALHANCCVTKLLDLGQFITVIQSIKDFWFNVAHLPPAGCN